MYTIKEMKLLNRGVNGAEIKLEEHHVKNMLTIVDDNKKTRKLPISCALKKEINRLKFYVLVISGLWNQDWDIYLNEDLSAPKPYNSDDDIDFDGWQYTKIQALFSNLYITGFSTKSDGFDITAEYETEIQSKVITIKTPVIVSSDEFNYYAQVIEVMVSIKEAAKKYLENDEFLKTESKDLLLQKTDKTDQEELERIDSLSEDETQKEMLQSLAAKGAIIIMDEMAKEMNIADDDDSEEEPEEEKKEDKEEVKKEVKEEPVGAEEKGSDW